MFRREEERKKKKCRDLLCEGYDYPSPPLPFLFRFAPRRFTKWRRGKEGNNLCEYRLSFLRSFRVERNNTFRAFYFTITVSRLDDKYRYIYGRIYLCFVKISWTELVLGVSRNARFGRECGIANNRAASELQISRLLAWLSASNRSVRFTSPRPNVRITEGSRFRTFNLFPRKSFPSSNGGDLRGLPICRIFRIRSVC